MNVLVINCGSSSLKFQLINAESEEVLAKGICERIGIDGRLTYQPEGGEKEKSDKPMPTHTEEIQFVIEALTNTETGVVGSLDEIGAVGTQEKGISRRDCSSTALWLAAFFSQYTQEAGAIVVMVDIHIGDLSAQKLLVSDGVVPR